MDVKEAKFQLEMAKCKLNCVGDGINGKLVRLPRSTTCSTGYRRLEARAEVTRGQ